ncbi:MAG TPA: hypothetical protein VF383_03485 [Candidatus Dormibacteraeota bacterium]
MRSAGGATVSVAASGHSVTMPSRPADKHLDNLTDICGWLGTYRERLRMARRQRDDTGFLISRMTARYHLRAEPA